MKLLRGAVLVVLCAASLSYAGEDRVYVTGPDGERPEQLVAIENVCAWPNLTELPDGTIIATIFNKPSHGMMAGDVDCWATADGGRTWQKRGTPAPHENEHSNRMNVAAGLAGNGDLLVIASGWTGLDTSGKLGERPFRERILAPWVCRSTDGGRTWTRDTDAFPDEWPEAASRRKSREGICVPFGDILPGADGALRVAMYTGGRGAGFVFRSPDDGKTWGEPVAFTDDAVLNEPAIFHLGDGNWLAATRSNGLDLYASDDDAKSWTHRQKVTGPQQHPGHIMRLADGRLLLTYGNRLKPKGVDVRLSDDEGHTWSAPVRVADFQGDGGYPSSVQLPGGQVMTAYYARATSSHSGYHMGVVRWSRPTVKSKR
ncbi:MAG: sialidase family protein [Pirellulaceae bacterium]